MPHHSAALFRNALIAEHLDVARNVARKMAHRAKHLLPREDIEAAALLGLTEAAARYDERRSEPFFAFAVKRVRGAILDELRRVDELSRRERWRARAVARARADLEQRFGRAANDNEVAAETGLSSAEVTQARAQARIGSALAYDDELAAGQPDERSAMIDAIDRRRRLGALRTALSELSARDREVVQLYYGAAMNLREIGERLGVSESRVCQLRARAERTLRAAVLGAANAPANDARPLG